MKRTPKGALVAVEVLRGTDRRPAKDFLAPRWRDLGHQARIFKRTVRADGVAIDVRVLIVRERLDGGQS